MVSRNKKMIVKQKFALNMTHLWLSKKDLAYFWNKPDRIKTRRNIGF
jgi:hypothetical protein